MHFTLFLVVVVGDICFTLLRMQGLSFIVDMIFNNYVVTLFNIKFWNTGKNLVNRTAFITTSGCLHLL